MTKNTKTKGNLGEIQIAAEFVKWGCTVSFPFGDNARYDLIADIKGELKKVQVKYTSNSTDNDSYLCKCHSSTGKKSDKYVNDVDFIALYIQSLNQCLLIPIEFVKKRGGICLRNSLPKNNQIKNVNFIKDWTFDKYFETLACNSDG